MSTTAPKPATTPIPVQLSDQVRRLYLPLDAHVGCCGLSSSLIYLMVLYTGMQWKSLPIPRRPRQWPSTIRPSTKSLPNGQMTGRSGRRSWPVCGISRPRSNSISPCSMATGPTPWPKRGDGIGYSGHKHQKGEKVIAIIDNHGSVLAPVPVAPVNETDMVLFPEA